MANTMTLIASSTVGAGGVNTFTFSSIPSTYTDLKVVASIRMSVTNSDTGVYFNTAATDSFDRNVFGNGTSAGSDTHSNQQSIYIGPVNTTNQTASTFSSFEMYVPNYGSSNQKPVTIDHVQENSAVGAYATLAAGLSTKTAAISSITFYGYGGTSLTYGQYTTFYLYGIKNS
jgi:hypothetical protein